MVTKDAQENIRAKSNWCDTFHLHEGTWDGYMLANGRAVTAAKRTKGRGNFKYTKVPISGGAVHVKSI